MGLPEWNLIKAKWNWGDGQAEGEFILSAWPIVFVMLILLAIWLIDWAN